jgi:hypothetical protein
MDNETGLAILSSVLDKMSYPNQISSSGQDDSNGIDVLDLYQLLMRDFCIKGRDFRKKITTHGKFSIIYKQGEINSNPLISYSIRRFGKCIGTSQTINVFIITPTGKTILCSISPSAEVEELKYMIRSKEGIPIDEQRLIYARKLLEDGSTLEDYNIENRSTLHLLLGLRGGYWGYEPIVLKPSLLDTPYHYDFTNISDNGRTFSRGGSIYTRPCGWQRYALKVDGKFTDDIWLDGKSRRSDIYSSAEGEWAVSYHGTCYQNGLSIAEEGYKLAKCTRKKFGPGIYSTPDIEVATLYAAEANVDGKTYKVIMQNRVNPQTVIKFDKAVTKEGEFWISSNEDDIRPYGFCVKEL